jgi:hypothetical protein
MHHDVNRRVNGLPRTPRPVVLARERSYGVPLRANRRWPAQENSAKRCFDAKIELAREVRKAVHPQDIAHAVITFAHNQGIRPTEVEMSTVWPKGSNFRILYQ